MRVNSGACSIEECDYVGLTLRRGWCPKHYKRWEAKGDPRAMLRRENGSEPYDAILFHGWERHGECLLYCGKTDRQGYGWIGTRTGAEGAHRVSYEKWHGPIPEGLYLDHDCHNKAALKGECLGGASCIHRRCVNPGHLSPVTASQNFTSSPLTPGGGAGSPGARFNALKTHCPWGHEYTPANTIIHHGSRECRECVNERARRFRAKMVEPWLKTSLSSH